MASGPGSVTLRLGPQGRLVVPVRLRRELGLEPGEALVAHVEDGRLVMERRAQILRRLRDELRGATGGGSGAVDALLAERRDEARREADGER